MKLNRRRMLGPILAGAALAATLPGLARGADTTAGEAVDVALLMAVDASASISRDDLALQLDGHAAAFRSQAVHAAIQGLPSRRLAASLVLFAEPERMVTLVPWMVVSSAQESLGLADAIAQAPGVALGGSTALGATVIEAVRRLERCPHPARRKVVDVVSNGFSNAGTDPLTARGYAEEAGATVNALVILDEYDWLEAYFQDQVVTRNGFVRVAKSDASFAEALLAKLVTEIA